MSRLCCCVCGKTSSAFQVPSELHPLRDIVSDIGNGDAYLLHTVALADGNAVVGSVGFGTDGVEIKGDAEWSADLVLAAVALADGAGLVVVDHELLGKLVVKLHCGACEYLFLAQGENCALEGSESGMQVQNGAYIVFALLILTHDLLVVGLAEEGKSNAVAAEGGLDDIGDVVLVGILIEVGQILAGGLLMAAEVVVGAVGDAPELAPVGERKSVFNVSGGSGIEGQLSRFVIAHTEVFLTDTEGDQPVFAEVFPVSEPLKIGARLAEEFAFHLLEFAGAESEVTRGDFVAEGLADLAYAEGQLLAGGALDICKVNENALSGLGTQIAGAAGVLGHADGGFEHEIELADGGEIVFAADRADYVLV